MPHGRGHRRVHSYFSGFTGVEIDQPIQKAVSSSSLHVKLQTTSPLSKVKSAQDVCNTIVEDCSHLQTCLELQALSKKQGRNTFVTVPSFVKHSVKHPEPMARPRSPKSKSGGECSHQQMEDKLDQTLLAIRQQLNDLSDERAKMEQQMHDIINGIREARQQCHNQRRRQSSNRILTPGSLRRMSSAGAVTNSNVESKRAKQPVSPESPKSIGIGVPDAPRLAGSITNSTSVTSQESIEDSPVFAHKSSLSDSLNSSISTHSLPAYRSIRSQSTSSSVKDRVNSDTFSEYSRSQSLSQDEWIHSSVILEVPEPSRLSSPGRSPVLNAKHNQSTPTLNYQSSTTPRSKSGYKTSTPNNYMPEHMMTSSPDISKRGIAKQEHYSCQSLTRSQRNSLPDSVMNSIILEDQVDTNSCYDSLSQLSSCTDEGSPKSRGSTLILRRSSLTGQLEHIRRPRLLVKRNSSFGTSSEKHRPLEHPRCESSCSLHDSSNGQGFKVLTRGFRKSAKRKPKKSHVILPSVETTV